MERGKPLLTMSLMLVFVLISATQMAIAAEKPLARFKVKAEQALGETPVSVPFNPVLIPQGKVPALVEVTSAGRVPTPCQAEPGYAPRLWWILRGSTPPGRERVFELTASEPAQAAEMQCSLTEENIVLSRRGQPLINYRRKVMPPPAGVDSLFARSGFIHPLWAPNGKVLTAIQPPDHYHHYGIWNPWTKTRFQGREVDFWNLGGGQGTVKYVGLVSAVEGPVYAGFKVLQEHVDLTQKPPVTALNELWDVRAWAVGDAQKLLLWDLHTTLSCAGDSSLLFEAYRYGGGIGYRAVEMWTKENCTVLTSEGKTRLDADGTRARWCRIEGDDGNGGRMGILFMSRPDNREHPEPMRVWPEDANNGRGDLFFEFCPIRHNDWLLEPRREYSLHYRMAVFVGDLPVDECERLWRDFAAPPKVTEMR